MTTENDPVIIKGWKAIADALNLSKRTLLRYHRFWPLPVRYLQKRIVFVSKTDLCEWLRQHTHSR